MQIRPFHKEDQAAVIQLWEECGLTRPWNSPDKDIARKLTTQPEWFLVGTIDDRIVATLMAGYDGHRGWINYLGVDPDHQRQGLAKMMMEEAERLLLDFGCPKINLLIRGDNVEAIEFYKQIGFTEDAVVNFGKRLIPDE
ncbi:MAG: ribosomal protein S18 acetylase RimI-like enzyme [Pirellulaceae bacterium]|jgi:ribosomal protein S18 acetylase RimI-like enzyme